MERKIGEIFEYDGEWLQCIEQPSDYIGCVCDICVFKCFGDCYSSECMKENRQDGNDVIFKKLEKVGEPYFNEQLGCFFQQYELHYNDLSYIAGDTKYIKCGNKISIETNQNVHLMEEKKDRYDGYMDKECIPICDALNSLHGMKTTSSCCGHCENRFMIFLNCNDAYSLSIIARSFDRRYSVTHQQWHIEMTTCDNGGYNYFLHSEKEYDNDKDMMEDVLQLIDNIEHWKSDRFKEHFQNGIKLMENLCGSEK